MSLLVLLMLVAAACGGDDGPTTAAPEETPPEPTLCPLTGVETDADAPIDRPALAVKIDNAPPARPQVGLEAADIVFEELGEGGLTRFLAFFHCEDAADLGPVRSARNVDLDILQEFAPVLFGYSGANKQVLAKVDEVDGLVDLVHGSFGDAYRREGSREAPYNLFTTTEALLALEPAGEIEGPPSVGFEFDAELLEAQAPSDAPAQSPDPEGAAASPEAADVANEVAFQFSGATRIRYAYDEPSKTYLRFHGDEAHTAASGQQLGAVNVVVLKVEIVDGTVRDASGTLTKDTKVVGSGEAVVVRAGQVEFGTWNRASLDDQTTLQSRDGGDIALAPGPTWIHLVDVSEPVTVQ